MKLTRNAKVTLLVVAVLAAAAVGYAAYGGHQAVAGTACPSTGNICTHADSGCAGCPYVPSAAREANGDGASQASSSARVDASKCIGCAKCVRVAPDAFKMNPSTNKAEVKPGAPAAAVEKGAKACPVGAVSR
ncbi:MAG TPA: hypothetical protein DGT21_25570 [Armatimonadetes bacterium]|nr:hypothetical protein [Armatimonadota bacterium]